VAYSHVPRLNSLEFLCLRDSLETIKQNCLAYAAQANQDHALGRPSVRQAMQRDLGILLKGVAALPAQAVESRRLGKTDSDMGSSIRSLPMFTA
jgi:hypothetical protein